MTQLLGLDEARISEVPLRPHIRKALLEGIAVRKMEAAHTLAQPVLGRVRPL